MSRSKKIFLIFAAIFITIMLLIMYDIARKTTFPGGSKNKTELPDESGKVDSLNSSINNNHL
jgi:hypothetical protein